MIEPMASIALKAARAGAQHIARCYDRPDLIKISSDDNGIFTNVNLVMQQLAATMSTVMYSIFGIIATIGRMVQGLQSTMHGIWKGEPGHIIRLLAL